MAHNSTRSLPIHIHIDIKISFLSLFLLIRLSKFTVIAKCNAQPTTTIKDLKAHVYSANKKLHPHRQALRQEVRGKSLKDSDTAESLGLRNGSKLYFRDLGPQIGWSTVFMCEYAGPLIVYLWIYQRPWLFYGDSTAEISQTAQ